MWETIKETLNGGNSLQVLIFLTLTIGIVGLLIKGNYLKINTNVVKIGASEQERAVLRQQNEWTYQFVTGLYGEIMKQYPLLNPIRTRYILELMYDEIMVWITFNHISKSEMYVMVKQEKLRSIVFRHDVDDCIKSDEFRKKMDDWTKDIIYRLVDIREYYSK